LVKGSGNVLFLLKIKSYLSRGMAFCLSESWTPQLQLHVTSPSPKTPILSESHKMLQTGCSLSYFAASREEKSFWLDNGFVVAQAKVVTVVVTPDQGSAV
jgi:hypothetical protein